MRGIINCFCNLQYSGKLIKIFLLRVLVKIKYDIISKKIYIVQSD